MLPDTVLSMPVKYILVMFNLHNLCLWKPQKDLFRTRMIADAAFHINMGKTVYYNTRALSSSRILFPSRLSLPAAGLPVHIPGTIRTWFASRMLLFASQSE